MIRNLFKRGAVTAGAAFLAVSVLGGVAHADPGVPYIKPSQRSQAVSCVQQGLRDAGYNIDVDGIYGQATYSALTDFQAQRGLQADGIVGPRTGDRLYYDYLAKSGNVVQIEECGYLIPTTR
ncbi:peptidoglycan-binding domain-containing protein [Kitasatospora aureofaciens]|uniref:peptidoglycan-binding domain-containing protein n=1 Tax=Kitasatospora aureofaciens TaxID=1894 RepID=UPI000527A96C|nr:peptidoglycan-binding domain-containing protein [Kitasatospora aureofaciens]HJD83029.1 peptidoglycan-binding protein [Kitasatospora aureofaciens]